MGKRKKGGGGWLFIAHLSTTVLFLVITLIFYNINFIMKTEVCDLHEVLILIINSCFYCHYKYDITLCHFTKNNSENPIEWTY